MAFVPVPNVISVEVRALFDNQKIENRLHVAANEAITPAIVDGITGLVDTWVRGTYFTNLPAAVTLREVVGTDLSSQNGHQITIVGTGTLTGGLNSEPMPNETTFCVKLNTGNRGRSARGRLYVLGTIKPDFSGNNYLVARANAHVAAVNDLIGALNDSGYSLVIVSYRNDNAPRPGGPVTFDVTSASYSDLLGDSMRRRKPGNGS